MTIEEQIEAFEYFKKCGIFPFSDTRTRIVFTDECINGVLDTMRKYQKIKEQVDIAIDKENFAISGARLIQIREIINGNDD